MATVTLFSFVEDAYLVAFLNFSLLFSHQSDNLMKSFALRQAAAILSALELLADFFLLIHAHYGTGVRVVPYAFSVPSPSLYVPVCRLFLHVYAGADTGPCFFWGRALLLLLLRVSPQSQDSHRC